jgi:hypothetical protein
MFVGGDNNSWGIELASDKQLAANKANARKSTGPRTQAGKARSRLNSRKHGLTAKLLVIGNEDPAEFEELRAALIERYDPQGAAEGELVDYLAGIYWRLRRFPLFEAAILAARQAQVADEHREDQARLSRPKGEEAEDEVEGDEKGAMCDAERQIRLGRALIKDGVWNDALGKLSRHEATLYNALRKTLTLLEEIREERTSDHVTTKAAALSRAA